MRIGLVRRGFSPAGGAESYLKGFARAAQSAGHDTVLFGSPEWTEWAFGEKVLVNGKTPRAFSDSMSALRPKEKCDVLFSLERISQCDVYRAGDGVHAAWLQRRSPFETPLKRLTLGLNPKHRALLALEKEAMTNARHVIVNSRLVAGEITSHYGPEVSAKVRLVYNGIDPSKWTNASAPRSELREKFGLRNTDRVAVFVGSGWDRKGLQFAIAATQKTNCILLVTGKGDPARYSAPHVRFLGPTPLVTEVLHAADVFILPTIYDPFSNATLEALAAGLPIVTTTSNGVAEILDPLTDGTAVESPNDVDALSSALERWIQHPEKAERQEHAARFTLERNFQETLHIIES